ncbi:nickel pincer cofactor biosynthesis protein LarB [Sporomusa aerivorans]|uniref:nickel pincer cofactor biosynthesis protein LarB n=1 Tax=Sporomusa aerivorans TaxID=204936 RepID=UPI00352A98C9
MNTDNIRGMLESFREGAISLEQVLGFLKSFAYEDIEFAKIDHHRAVRQGFPEVVFCQGKTIPQVATIMKKLAERSPNVLGTRASKEMFAAVKEAVPEAWYHELARLIVVERSKKEPDADRYILVLSAGTSDMPVAEEAAVTAEIMGHQVQRVYDVGVAGIHRLLAQRETICKANVSIVVAGMEGALASVVGGLVDKPIIAVPTSIGYGANFQGLAALLSMLNSCAAGVAVVNIDNGFGAGRLASIINTMR